MIKWTKIILATFVSFLISYYWGRFAGFTGFSFAWVFNFILMIWYTYLDSLFNWKLKSKYFETKSFEKGGSIYEYSGVNYYRKLLVLVGWEKISRKNNKILNDRKSLELAEYGSKSSETGHSVIFLIVLVVTFLVANSLRQAFWLILINLLLNLYPVFVQRYNRPRYQRILQKMEHYKQDLR